MVSLVLGVRMNGGENGNVCQSNVSMNQGGRKPVGLESGHGSTGNVCDPFRGPRERHAANMQPSPLLSRKNSSFFLCPGELK